MVRYIRVLSESNFYPNKQTPSHPLELEYGQNSAETTVFRFKKKVLKNIFPSERSGPLVFGHLRWKDLGISNYVNAPFLSRILTKCNPSRQAPSGPIYKTPNLSFHSPQHLHSFNPG